MRNEAQLAGVIAHESGHFLRRHMIRSWRDQKRKSDIFAIGAMAAGVAGAGAGVYLGDYVQLAQLGTLLSLFAYSRAMEAEADAMGARLIAEAGYPPIEMANVWEQLIGEMDASAAYRRKHRRRGSLFRVVTFNHLMPAFSFVLAFYVLARAITAIRLLSSNPIADAGALSHQVMARLIEALALLMPALDSWTQTAWLFDQRPHWSTLLGLAAHTALFMLIFASAAVFDMQRRNL